MFVCPGDARRRGQSEVLGYLLVFVLVGSGIALTVLVGGAGLADTQSQSELERAENSMTLFDSRAAMVALGDASVQTVSLGHDSGSIQVDEEAGWMRVTHNNYTAEQNAPREVVFNESLGEVVYVNDDRELAYQGGGVWKQDSDGQARMVSPPEFHYRGATLTLPVIRTSGEGAVSGSVDMAIRPLEQARRVYPNQTTATEDRVGAPYNETGNVPHRSYTNPVRNGTVNITVHSQYYEGWAEYFDERTTGTVTKWDHNETVRLELETVAGPPADFDMPEVGDSVRAGAIGNGHPVSQFEVTIDVEKNKPHFSFYAEDNGEEFELHVYSTVNSNECPDPDAEVHLSLYYYDADGSETFESWESDGLDPDETDGLEWQCDADDDLSLYVDFVEDGIDMHYDEIGSKGSFDPGTDGDPECGDSTGVTRGNKYAFNDHMNTNCEGWDLRDPATWDQHSDASSVGYEPTDYSRSDVHSLDEVTNHYLASMDDEVDLIAKDGPGNSDSIHEQGSSGVLLYDESADARFVTYLHITENRIEVALD